jgi:hypothetical protein
MVVPVATGAFSRHVMLNVFGIYSLSKYWKLEIVISTLINPTRLEGIKRLHKP